MSDFSTGGAPASPSGPRADWGTRLIAYLIDVAILFAVIFVLSLVLDTIGMVLGYLATFGYLIYLEGSPAGQTLGKRVMNIRVIDYATGGPIGYGKAALRTIIGRTVAGFVCGLGYLWAIWDKEKQGWHDKVATTVVVPTSAYPVSSWP